jgi:flavodoxin I
VNALIIYDSTFGNTERIARRVASTLEEKATVRLIRVDEAATADLQGIDLVILGGPTHRHRASAAIQAFLDSLARNRLRGVSAAAFDTRYRKSRLLTGSAASALAKSLRKAGASRIVAPESFFVAGREGPLEEGEVERAADWAREVVKRSAERTR